MVLLQFPISLPPLLGPDGGGKTLGRSLLGGRKLAASVFRFSANSAGEELAESPPGGAPTRRSPTTARAAAGEDEPARRSSSRITGARVRSSFPCGFMPDLL